ncbi:metallophosphoesterase [Tessaracoccus caeni]|uniref:metallophosphoesterase n=1 Tax=Tessaracoccus caeni TaxID=3031239 RepID=UPI0023DB04FF|nr:metallophosphoesterase [Tessaracoccus caeni]MDF1490065.1 metallophosphoesterase [Tessaracoccus caeni]
MTSGLRGTLVKTAGATVALGAACFGWGLIEAGLYTLRRFTMPVLPAGAEPLRVLHFSDFHLRPGQRRELEFIAGLADLKPDLVLNTGDNFTDPAVLPPLLEALSGLRGVPGAFVFGSNDYYFPNKAKPLTYLFHGRSRSTSTGRRELPWQELKSGLERLGWEDATHRRLTLEAGALRLALRGVDDAHLNRDDYSTVAGPADADADLNIGIMHAPYLRTLDAMTADGMDLLIAGHTHGGQVCVPCYGALTSNCDLPPSRAKGVSVHTHGGRSAPLHVSAGLGTSPMAPYRFACRPEASLLTLVPRVAG